MLSKISIAVSSSACACVRVYGRAGARGGGACAGVSRGHT